MEKPAAQLGSPLIQIAETTHTGLDKLAEMGLKGLCWWCDQTRR